MASRNENTTFGASIVPTQTNEYRPEDALIPPRAIDSPVLTPAVSHEDMGSEYEHRPVPPHSPFYSHPPASFERVHSRQTSQTKIATPFEKDIESGGLTPLSAVGDENPFTSKVSIDASKECKMWPSKQTLMQERAAEREKKRTTKGFKLVAPIRSKWASLDKKQKLITKILLALFIIGAIVGICVGISVAVHGSYYTGNNGQQAVGQQ